MKRKYLAMAAVAALAEALFLGCGAVTGAVGDTPPTEESVDCGTVPEQNGNDGTSDDAEGRSINMDSINMDGINTEDTERNSQDIGETDPHAHESHMQPVRMVMLDGKLYVETGETNSMLRCGVMDGAITKTTDGETPTQDNQSNFGKDIGYQYGMRQNRIEIYLDDAWRIFAYNENNLKGLDMEVSDVTAKGCTVTFTNDSGSEITFGEDFRLERLDTEREEWTYVPVIVDGEWGFNMIGYPVADGESRALETDWQWLYGTLEPGQYRIVKSVTNSLGEAGYTEYTLSSEFVVE